MRHAILVTGGNAAGKTTAVAEAVKPWISDLRVQSFRADNDSQFKGESPEQEAAVRAVWISDIPIIIFEGTRINTPLQRVAKALPDERIFIPVVCIQKPDVMKAHMIARCEKRNKKFRSEYWTYSKLEYEGVKRYQNNLRKNGIRPFLVNVELDYTTSQTVIIDLIQAKVREVLHEP